jgi:oligopeptide/dipeptide ABC transporter ATP-binding protein
VLLEVNDLSTHFRSRHGAIRAVDCVSFTLDRGESLAVVGESGSGKSVMARSLIGLIPDPPGKIVGGSVLLDGTDVLKLKPSQLRHVRGKRIGMIFQDPMRSLDPVFPVGTQISEGLGRDAGGGRRASDRVEELLALVGISNPASRRHHYPHEFSGGMRQRVGAAIAIAGNCDLLIADEPTTALDVTVQAQFLTVLAELQQVRNLAIIFITHDLGIVANVCQRVAVMYAGRIVETGSVRDIFQRPAHPYTRALLNSMPVIGAQLPRLIGIEGQPPDPFERPRGCAFSPRCPLRQDRCELEAPPTQRSPRGDRSVECWAVEHLA